MLLSGLAIVVPGAGNAREVQCASYTGQVVSPSSFEQAIALSNAPEPKGEFETTAAYQARVAGSGGAGPIIISKKPEDSKYLEYDADRQAFAVKSFFFHNTNMPAWEIFYHAENGVTASTMSNIDIVVSEQEKITGSYSAQNGFGAKTNVTKIFRTIKGVFERDARSYSETLFPGEDAIVGYIPMAVEAARAFKPQAKAAFVVTPKAPFVTRAEFPYGKTTIQNPTDVTIGATVLHADIQCALLLDAGNKVLGAFETR